MQPDSSAAQAAVAPFVAAVNTNDIDNVLPLLCDGIALFPPEGPVVRGKAAVQKFSTDFFARFRYHVEIIVGESYAGDNKLIVFCTQKETRTRRSDGKVFNDTIDGQIVFIKCDNKWLIEKEKLSLGKQLAK